MQRSGRSDAEWRAIVGSIDLIDSPGHVFRVLENKIHERYYEITPRQDISPRQIAVLIKLFQVEKATQTELAKLINLDRSTLSEMGSRMVDRGLIKSSIADHDRRAITLEITALGKKALFETINPVLQAQREMMALIPDDLRVLFRECLHILYRHTLDKIEEADAASNKPATKRKKRERA